jgi:dihydrofolate reductase
MKVTLYNAISADGFIADKHGDSSWVSPIDEQNFNEAIESAGNVILGRKTFEQFENELFPIAGVKNFVFTRDANFARENKDFFIINQEPEIFVEEASAQGIENLLLIGGGNLNASFLNQSLIDEMILVVHPIVLGSGIKLFEGQEFSLMNLELISSKELGGGLLQLKYKIKK